MTDLHRHDTTGHVDELDPANQSLAEALRKSFRVLKLIMLVLVVLYFLSGWFSLNPSERGVVLRYGRIVGAGPNNSAGDAVLGPGWHWSWPYPIERSEKVSASEREIPIRFMFQLSDEEQTGGIQGYKFSLLSPLRDDYLITGNVNILHAALVVKYKISDPVAYLTNVAPMPSPTASARSKPYELYPEYTVLTDLIRSAVIETAATRTDLDIRGAKQDEFFQAVAACCIGKLKSLEQSGMGLGISIDPINGVIAPKTGGIEGIMPPRQTQQAFDDVDKANSSKVIAITKADTVSRSLLVNTAGPDYETVKTEVIREFDLMRKLAVIDEKSPEADGLRKEMEAQREAVDKILTEKAGGEVRNIVKRAEIKRNQIVKEAQGDYQQFKAVLPEYLRHPDIFVSQLLSDTFAAALRNDQIAKIYVPETVKSYWLQIPRSSLPAADQNKSKEPRPGVIESDPRPMNINPQ